jgi:hypothetical protein
LSHKNVIKHKKGGKSGPPQWEKSNKFVPLGKTKKIFFYTQIDFL